MGLITPVGVGREHVWAAFTQGRSGISDISESQPLLAGTTIAGRCTDFRPSDFLTERELPRHGRVSQMALAAAKLAAEDASLAPEQMDNFESGVMIGTAMGGQGVIEDYCASFYLNDKEGRSAFTIPKSMYSASASDIAARFKARGPNLTISTACSSGAHAIGQAFQLIRYGHARRMLAGGVETPLTPAAINAWKELRALSTSYAPPERACKPFSANRDGLVLAEGAGMVVLEELDDAVARGAHVYAEVLGYAALADAGHMTAPDPDGEAQTIRHALRDSGVGPEEIDYINAHGTATRLSDIAETEAIKRVFGSRAYEIPVSSLKSMIGHALGASGAIEFCATALAIENSLIPPTINFEQPDPQCDLDYVTEGARPAGGPLRLRTAMTNSFGFGGNNAILVLRECET
jgi:3-oxoacyl-[acyl-carrier-protein] synthase II